MLFSIDEEKKKICEELNCPNNKVSSKLFDIFDTRLLKYFPDDEIIYLDNFIRCKLPFSNREITNDCSIMFPYANCCNQLSLYRFNNLKNIKCLIISGICQFVWFENKKMLFYESADVKKYLEGFFNKKVKNENKKNKVNSVMLLGEQFRVDGLDFPIYFFPHPKVLQPRSWNKHYALGNNYHTQYINGRDKIIQKIK